jgi:hypothetical protein
MFLWRMCAVRGCHIISGTVVVNATSTHDAHYTMPCHCRFRKHRHDCISVNGTHYAADHQSRAVVCPRRQGRTTDSTAKVKFLEKLGGEKICWPHLWVRSITRGGPRGHYRYPVDWVHLCTGFKTRQRAGHNTLPRALQLRTLPPY